MIEEAPNNILRRDVLRCVDTDVQRELVEIGNKLLT